MNYPAGHSDHSASNRISEKISKYLRIAENLISLFGQHIKKHMYYSELLAKTSHTAYDYPTITTESAILPVHSSSKCQWSLPRQGFPPNITEKLTTSTSVITEYSQPGRYVFTLQVATRQERRARRAGAGRGAGLQ